MRLRSEAEIPQPDWRISHKMPLLLSGSCFSERVGDLLLQDKFEVLANPFGTVYHPLPLVRALHLCAKGDLQSLLGHNFLQGGIWRNWLLTGELADPSAQVATEKITQAFERTRAHLLRTEVLVLTFGTAWGYALRDKDLVVANCHKAPQAAFERRIHSPEEMLAAILPQLRELLELRPGLRLVFTVSPVRHLREGLANDRLSKSALRWLCHLLTDALSGSLYFPSYELVVDDLRDYRFTEPDLMHPTAQATAYVYERFGESLFSQATHELLGRWRSLRRELDHRPQFPGSEAHLRFVEALRQKLMAISPELDVSQELDALP